MASWYITVEQQFNLLYKDVIYCSIYDQSGLNTSKKHTTAFPKMKAKCFLLGSEHLVYKLEAQIF
jgi:hypothetical protein